MSQPNNPNAAEEIKPPYDSRTFYAAEFVALRAEVLQTLSDVRALERYVAAACAAIWAWSATHRGPQIVLAIPIVLCLLGIFRAIAYKRDFDCTHEYIGRIERLLGELDCGHDFPGGWEHFDKGLAGKPSKSDQSEPLKNGQSNKKGLITKSSEWFWGLLFLTSIAAPVAIPWYLAKSPSPTCEIIHIESAR
jgi:hypothetical protein